MFLADAYAAPLGRGAGVSRHRYLVQSRFLCYSNLADHGLGKGRCRKLWLDPRDVR